MSLGWQLPPALGLLALPLAYLWLARRPTAAFPMPRAGGLRSLGSGWLGTMPTALRTTALVALVLAVAGPLTPGAVVEERTEGVPIVLAVDLSSSMLAQDFEPSDRLTVARSTIARFVEGRRDDPIGVVAFAAEALTLVPTTTHRPIVRSALGSLQVGLLEDGTAIGDGLATAVNRVGAAEGEGGIVVLLSDGESNQGTVDPLAAAAAAAARGVQVFTVGVGSQGIARIPVQAGPVGFRYAELPVGVDEALLTEIAALTGGAYFRATDAEALERIYQEIDRRVPSTVQTTRRTEEQSWSLPLLILATGLLAAEWVLRGSRWGALP